MVKTRGGRRLAETAEVAVVADELGTDIAFQNALSLWSRVPVPELSIVLAHLRALSLTHQVHHWQAKGDPFFGDHKLFEQLYTGTLEEIDSIAERAVGLGGPENVDLAAQLGHSIKLIGAFDSNGTIPVPSMLAKRSLDMEFGFIRCLDLAAGSMRDSGTLTRGTDNLLAGIEDAHESNVYLLKQRVSSDMRVA